MLHKITVIMRRLLFKLARSSLMGWIIGWVFGHMSWAIPVKRLHETKTLMAFYHPKPSYPIHILIVPKKSYTSMAVLSADDTDFMVDLFATVQTLVNSLDLSAYRLICNGGDYQTVPNLL